ncbi:MAG TPA: hypothetical protein VHB30_15010 [Solirubrobacteraceae bacterium]|jgi:hypothetical protein|nr:hypothetical protein [Solirubrobacteraceae bacterium]
MLAHGALSSHACSYAITPRRPGAIGVYVSLQGNATTKAVRRKVATLHVT